MREDQLDKIHGIFKPEKMKIRPSVIKVPKELSLNWEIVGRRNNKEGVTTNIFKYFMPRNLKGSENHFFYTGYREHDFILQMPIFWRTLRNINRTGF